MADNTLTCSTCNKIYSSKETLLKHQRSIHNEYRLEKEKREKTDEDKCYHCKFCDNKYAFVQSRWRHEKTCKISKTTKELTVAPQVAVILEPIHQEMNKIKEESERQRQQIAELQKKLMTATRLDNKTFKAVNRILMDRSYRNSLNNNTNSNNNITNHITYQILSLGNEEMTDVLSFRQKKMILDSRLCSIEKIVEIAHCGQMNQYKNIIITNLKDNFAYKYDESKGYFITVSKAYLLDDVINHRMMDIEAIYDELKTANRIDDKTKDLIQKFLTKMESTDEPFYDNEIKYDNFKTFKSDRIKILLYNNHDKITKDIALLITDADTPKELIPIIPAIQT